MAIRNRRKRNFRQISTSRSRMNNKPRSIKNKQSWGEARDYSIGMHDENYSVSTQRKISTSNNPEIDVQYFSDGTKRMRWLDGNKTMDKSKKVFPIQQRLRKK